MVNFPENLFLIFTLHKQSKVDIFSNAFSFCFLSFFFFLCMLISCAIPTHILFLFGTEALLHNFSEIQECSAAVVQKATACSSIFAEFWDDRSRMGYCF